jgi:hypothetical protein
MSRHTVVRIPDICGFSNYILQRVSFIFLDFKLDFIHSAYTTYEDGTDRVFRNVGTKFRRRGITQKERIQSSFFLLFFCIKCGENEVFSKDVARTG